MITRSPLDSVARTIDSLSVCAVSTARTAVSPRAAPAIVSKTSVARPIAIKPMATDFCALGPFHAMSFVIVPTSFASEYLIGPLDGGQVPDTAVLIEERSRD